MSSHAPLGPPGPGTGRASTEVSPEPDLGSWEDIVAAYRPGVLRRAYRLTSDRHDAQDLTQDVFVRVFRGLSTYEPGNFEAWVNVITTNLHRDRLRHARRIQFTALTDLVERRLAAPEPGPADLLETHNLDPDIVAALSSLPPKLLAVVALRDLDGLSYQQVGASLGVTLGTVRSRLHRGRARLRTDLAHRTPQLAAPNQRGGNGVSERAA